MVDKTAYHLPTPTSDEELTKVGPGTPMGEVMRRYWQPVGLSSDATNTPRQVRILCEDLILFRDETGRPGLLYPRCAHRGTSLYYGKVEGRGIRCCYHGWLFDVEGHCLEQPMEPEGGLHRDKIRQPGYPLREEYGMIFAYMGPPEETPAFPVFPFFNDLTDDEQIAADDTSIGSGGGVIVPCNWLQAFENVVDPFHVPILHGSFSGMQFTEALASTPECDFETTERGVKVISKREMPDQSTFLRITEVMIPNIRLVPNPRPDNFEPCTKAGWVVPIDDYSHRIYSLGRVKRGVNMAYEVRQLFNGRSWYDLTEEEHRAMPGDYEAQVGQGAMTFHSEEHLATSDRGVVMLRRLLREQVQLVAHGKSPANVVVGQPYSTVDLEAGNFRVE